ncbi:cytochrome P450 [Colletotrichum abscissum]|uniref:Cytochrome P450 n=1 Tax=Colletotrichum abscissum TaxID=1671311 RepID=A0A9Q0AZA7_9PEZI|nr:cytochrome P450 [Colletotrichum abscissum]
MQAYVLLVIVALFVGVQLLAKIYRGFAAPLASVPGPFFARFTDLWYAWRIHQGRFEVDNIELHRKYGKSSCWRGSTGQKHSLVSKTLSTKVIYGHGHAFSKSTWYDTWGDPNPHQWSLFSDRNEKRHSENRRLYQSMYSMSSLVHYESYVDECADLFSRRLSEMSGRGKTVEPVDMGHWFQCYAFDVVGMITYSKRLGFLDRGLDVGAVIKNLENHLYYATMVGVYSYLHSYLAPIRSRLGKRGTGRQFIVEFTKGCLADHQAKPKAVDAEDTSHLSEQSGTMDFLSKFLGKHSEDSSTFSQYHVLAGCVSNMVAGSDTTAISLSAILYQLLRNPKEMSKLQKEIDGFYSQRTGDPRRLNFQESLKLPYLQAVIKEALRLHPATGLPLERVVPEGGATIAGKFFPAGTIVGINTWVEHHHPSIFGEDAASFRPDRWLITDTDRLSAMNRHWMPFGLGSRTCIGRHISILEISKLMPRLLHEFDFEICRDAPWVTRNCWFVKPINFQVRVNARRSQVGKVGAS